MLTNKAAVKKYILTRTAELRPHWDCTRVSQQALDEIEARLQNMITRMVESHPTKGKTFQV